MMENLAIELKDVQKTFHVIVEDTSKEKKIFNKNPTKVIDNVVLDHINLQVKKGEILGIIGLNGSGKSTLLSIMAHILEPDSGSVAISGKVSSILELGMGFHSDLSGRENIYIKGEMYGFTRKQISERIDDIIEFSGIRNYIDNPLRTYSSGMQGRLAFSIMVNVDAEVMLLDEILSTGDPSFSNKAGLLFKKQLKSGKTVVFASQSTSQIEQICTRVIWIHKGKIIEDGSPKTVCSTFLRSINESFEMIKEYAQCGVAESQYQLASFYKNGINVPANQQLYLEWLEKAAIQGHTMAQIALADHLITSDDNEDRSTALLYYRSAAKKGNSDAKYKLSVLSDSNDYFDNCKEIRDIWKQLALTGHPSNKLQYGLLMYKTAWDGKDRKIAFDILKEYADEGSPDASMYVANMYRDGIGTIKDLEQYVYYLDKAACAGYIEAIKALADAYYNGKVLPKDDEKAFMYYLKGAELGNQGMQYQVAMMYGEGIGVPLNQKESDRWYASYSNSLLAAYQVNAVEQLKIFDVNTSATIESLLLKAASTNYPKALSILAGLYRGDGVLPVDVTKSRYYYLKSALNLGNPRILLADLYYRGMIFDQNFERAAELYRDLAYMCDANIDYRLYLMYRYGLGFKKDEAVAFNYLKRSAKRGNLDAQRLLNKETE